MADDDADDRELVRDAMQTLNLRPDIRFVADGEQLLDYLRHEGPYAAHPEAAPRPGIILLDLNRPKKSGRQALAEIKSDPQLRRIPVVVLTTSNAAVDIDETYELGASSYISKPAAFAALIEAMRGFQQYWLEIADLPTGAV